MFEEGKTFGTLRYRSLDSHAKRPLRFLERGFGGAGCAGLGMAVSFGRQKGLGGYIENIIFQECPRGVVFKV